MHNLWQLLNLNIFVWQKDWIPKRNLVKEGQAQKIISFYKKSYLKPYILQALLSDKKAALCQPRYCTFYAACLLTKKSCISKSYFFLSLTTREYWSIFTVECFKRFYFCNFQHIWKFSADNVCDFLIIIHSHRQSIEFKINLLYHLNGQNM